MHPMQVRRQSPAWAKPINRYYKKVAGPIKNIKSTKADVRRRPLSFSVAPSVTGRLGKHIQYQHASHDQADAYQRRRIKSLLEDHITDQGNRNNTGAGPHRVGDAYRYDAQRHRQTIERQAVSDNGDDGRIQPRKTVRRFQRGCGHDFGRNGDGKIDPAHGFRSADFSKTSTAPAPPSCSPDSM